MSKRLGYVAALTAAAVAIGAGLVIVGGEGAQDSREQPDAADAQTLAALGGDQTPRDLDRLGQSEIIGPGGGGRGFIRFESPGRRTTVSYESLDPAGLFTYQTTSPSAVIANPDATRVITIAADSGRFVAPNNQLDRGQFDGQVTLAIYESPDGVAVSLDSDTPRLRVHLVDATFDAQLGTIESDGQVLVTAPDFEFRGRQLSMVYSDLRQRLSRLEVAYGESLTFSPTALNPQANDAPTQPEPATQPATAEPIANESVSPALAAIEDAAASTAEAPDKADAAPRSERNKKRQQRRSSESAEEPSLYTAVFERDIRLVAPEATIDADILAVTFALDAITTDEPEPDKPRRNRTAASSDKPATTDEPQPTSTPQAGAERSAAPGMTTPTPTPPHSDSTPPTNTDTTDTTATAEPVAEPTPQSAPADPRSLFRPSPDDIAITWAGPLIVEPADRTPETFAGRDDAFIRLDGSPVRIDTANGESVVAPAVTYLRQAGRVTASGSIALPARVVDANGATLVGRSLDLTASTGQGTIQGPGSLTAAAPDADIPPTAIAFEDTLDLTFDAAAPTANAVAALGPLRVADFRGPIRVDDPRLTLTAQRRLTARFFEDTSSPRLANLDAEGDVAIAATPDGPAEPFAPGALTPPPGMVTLDADQLTVGFALDPTGREQPIRLAAARDVVAQSPELKLTS
ncbi:MAG: hypothetical protein AAF078_11000, partial [Planctomycetota bacterium]